MALNIKELLALADHLDQENQCDAADQIDELIRTAVVMVEDPEEEFKKKLEEEGFKPGAEVYVGRPEEELEPEDVLMPGEKEPTKEIDVNERLRADLSQLSEQGWDIFGPGELEQWLEIHEFRKMPPTLTESYLEKIKEEKKKMLESAESGSEETSAEDAVPEEKEAVNTKDIFEKLSNVADKLDKIGATEEADLIDNFIQKHAYDALDYKGEDPNAESSKAYDSKHHREQQLREPPERPKDPEGRDEHHGETFRPVDGTLSTRYCPHHTGVMLARVGENTYQCNLDGAVYNWETGYTDVNGNEIPGGSVAGQSPSATGYFAIPHRIFDSRESILNRVN